MPAHVGHNALRGGPGGAKDGKSEEQKGGRERDAGGGEKRQARTHFLRRMRGALQPQ